MPDLLTPQALATGKSSYIRPGPLLLETFVKHLFSNRQNKDKKGPAREDDILFDEAFVLMKTFIEIATKYPVAALQRFGQVRTPSPPWVALHRVSIPHRSLSSAADYLVEAFGGTEMAYKIAGGSKWWQVRAGQGLEGEWIVMKKDWKEYTKRAAEGKDGGEGYKQRSAMDGMVGEDGGVSEDGQFREEMDELRCMLYIHGGAYYWGSINTHRYTIWRHARKMHGRCFAVNYRKAPQYPFPCAIHDCLAAWLYLTNPPAEAKHKPVHPKNIILAGDSAGGGLVLALLQILRDTKGLELPAGAVLLSPWSDLTHSFPSILKNTSTDIIPPYGFIHKPSSLWPPPPPELTHEIQNRLRTRVKEAVSRLKEDHNAVGKMHNQASEQVPEHESDTAYVQNEVRTSSMEQDGGRNWSPPDGESQLHPTTEQDDADHHPDPQQERHQPSMVDPGALFSRLVALDDNNAQHGGSTTLAQDHTPLELEVDGKRVALDTQIQLYATNAQLCHPLISPALGYLGGLPPLFIQAGQGEVLRDEIVYVAHKAAHPEDFPVKDDIKALYPALKGIEERCGPTNVHLQIYDGACHDLPLFSMTKPARGLFRAVASFARYVTPSAPGSLPVGDSRQTSEVLAPPRPDVDVDVDDESGEGDDAEGPAQHRILSEKDQRDTPRFTSPTQSTSDLSSTLAPQSGSKSLSVPSERWTGRTTSPSSSTPASAVQSRSSSPMSRNRHKDWQKTDSLRPKKAKKTNAPEGDEAGPRFGDESRLNDIRAGPGEAGWPGVYQTVEPFKDHMIRERVDVHGKCRELGPASELEALLMPREEVGMIKEGPAKRYLDGQALWDKKFKRAIKRVARHRKRNIRNAREKDSGRIVKMWQKKMGEHKMREAERAAEESDATTVTASSSSDTEDDEHQTTRHSSEQEHEQASKAEQDHVKRTNDVLDQTWSWRWALEGERPPPSAIVSRRDFGEARQLALMADRMDSAHETPVHGLSIWVGLAAFFSSSSERSRAQEAVKQAKAVKKAEHDKRRAERAMEKRDSQGEKRTGKGEVGGIGKKLGDMLHIHWDKEDSSERAAAGI